MSLAVPNIKSARLPGLRMRLGWARPGTLVSNAPPGGAYPSHAFIGTTVKEIFVMKRCALVQIASRANAHKCLRAWLLMYGLIYVYNSPSVLSTCFPVHGSSKSEV